MPYDLAVFLGCDLTLIHIEFPIKKISLHSLISLIEKTNLHIIALFYFFL